MCISKFKGGESMKNVWKKIASLLIVTLMIVSMTACAGIGAGSDTDSSEGTFRIGLSSSYTGGTAQEGIEAKNAVEMALEMINEEGGFNGEQGVLATTYDNKGSPEEAVKASQKLIQNENVDCVIASNSSAEVLATGQFFEEAKLFTIGMGTSATWMEQGWEYVIRCSVNYDFVASEIVKMVKEMGITKIAIMKDQQEAGLSFAEEFERLAAEQGITVVASESCEIDDTDLSSQCSRLIDAKPEAILISMTSNDCGYFVKQIRQYGYTGLLFDKESFYADLVDIAGPDNSNYILFANPYVTYNDISECDISYMNEFLQKYLDKYGEMPRTEIGYRAWDAVMVIWEATKLAKSNKTEDMLAVVPQIKIQGLGGTMDYSNGDGEPYHNVSRFLLLNGTNISWEKWFKEGGYDAYKTETGNAF
jgi:branched-chain amino acid transport system substrate-binding protein